MAPGDQEFVGHAGRGAGLTSVSDPRVLLAVGRGHLREAGASP